VVSGHGRTLQRIGGAGAWRGTALLLLLMLGLAQLASLHVQIVLSWLLSAGLYGAMIVAIIRLSRDPALPEPSRRFWATLPLTGASSFAAAGIPLIQSLGAHGSGGALPGFGHGLFGTLAVVVLAWACLTYRWSGDTRRRQLRRWLDAASLLIAGLGALWYFEAGPLLGEHVSTLGVVAALLLDAFAMVALLAFLQPMTSDVRPIVRGAALIGATAVILGTVAEACMPAAIGTPWLRLLLVLRVAPAALSCLAVGYQRTHLHLPSKPARRSRRIYSRLPYLAILSTFVLLGLALRLNHADARTWGMFAAACAVTSLVVVRQTTAMSDNARLVRDLTASVGRGDALAAELHQHAFYDDLTRLPNRMLYADRLEHALVARRRSNAELAVIVVDLDDFKLVNDRFGHAEGDHVLREAAARLTATLRAGDTVARLGGDEFAILVHGADDDAVRIVASRVVEAFTAPFVLQDSIAELGVSVGVTMTTPVIENRDGATLLRHADIAMYSAKSGGKHRYEIFLPSMLDLLVTRHDTKQALTRAIADGDLVVHYQPIVDVADGQVRGVEALVRWQRPGHGMVPPMEFLTLAEEFGLIPDIDLFVLRQACEQVQEWNSHRAPDAQYCVHVNMSAVTLAHPEIVSQVAAALRVSGLPAQQLTVELTESTLMADPNAVIARMHALRQTGVRLAIDDFGTGYSSLAYLRDLPVDTVKVDKSFVDGIVGEEIDRELVKTIIGLAKLLGLDTVAEGVEGEQQAALLSAIGCSRMQGFLFARPMPPDQLEETGERVGRASGWLDQAALSSAVAVMVPAPR
jgi:diguanylate cyclase (GGDEF)-like protein